MLRSRVASRIYVLAFGAVGALACTVKIPQPPVLEVGETCIFSVDAPAQARAGDALTATLRIQAKPPYRVTQSYPVSVYVVGTEMVIPREIELADEQVQVDPTQVVAQAPFRVDVPGNHRFLAEARLSVCDRDRCEPVTVQRTWSLDVLD